METFGVGTVINFDNRNTFFGGMIGKFTKSKWSHSGLVYQHTKKYIWVAEAVANGYKVNRYSRKKLMKRWNKNTIQLRKSTKTLSSVKSHCDKYLDIKYGKLQLFKIAMFILFKKKYKVDDLKTLICSEGVARVLFDSSNKFINIANEFDCEYDYVTPYMISVSKLLRTVDK